MTESSDKSPTKPSSAQLTFLRWVWFALLAGSLSFAATKFAPQERQQIIQRTLRHAKLLARSLANQSKKSSSIQAPMAQSWITKINHSLKSVGSFKEAMVIVETSGEDLGFGIPLRETRFAAHSQQKKRKQQLTKTSAQDKELFDLTQNLEKESKKKPEIVHVRHLKKQQQFLVAAPIIGSHGKYLGSAVVRVPYLKPLKQKNLRPILAYGISWLVVIGLLGFLFFFVRGPSGHVFALLGLVGATLYPYVDAVERQRQREITQLQAEQQVYQAVLRDARFPSQKWLYQTLPHLKQTRALRFDFRKSSVVVSFSPQLVIAKPGSIPALPYVLLGLLSAFLYLLYAFGFVGRFLRTFLQHRVAYFYTVPAMLGMLVLVFVPFTVGIGLSFFQHVGGGVYKFVGLKHFGDLLTSHLHPFPSPLSFYFTLTVTILWTTLNVVLHVSIGLGLAMLLKNPLLRMKEVYRVLLILPWAIPNYITALIWKGMFHQQFGAINALRESVGLAKVHWFSEFSTSFAANLITNTWLGFPFMMVVALGALQSIPSDLYEAADVDGANAWQKFWHITMPLLKPALFPAIILGSIWTFNMFNVIYLVSGGGPEGSTDILITEAYHWAFTRGNHYGYAAAYSVIIFVILLGYSMFTNKVTKATEGVFSD